MSLQRSIGGPSVAFVALALLVGAVASVPSVITASSRESSTTQSAMALTTGLESHGVTPSMAVEGPTAAEPESASDSPSMDPSGGTLQSTSAEDAEAEDLVILGTSLRTLANLARSSTFFAQLVPSLVFGQLGAAVPAEVLAPLADSYFQAITLYGEAATGGADAFLGMADAFREFSPFVNPAASALGTAFLDVTSSAAQAVTEAGTDAGHHNSLPAWGADYLAGVGEAFGIRTPPE